MSEQETPKKIVSKGRRQKAVTANDFCRLCKCALKLKFGNFEKTTYVSSEQLFKPPFRKDCSEKTLFQLLTELNIFVERKPELSERVCKSCSRKIRNANGLFAWIISLVNVPNSSNEKPREKRLLPTTIDSPERSPQAKKQPKPTSERKTVAKKSLFPNERDTESQTAKCDDKTKKKDDHTSADNFLAAMNIEQLVHKETATQVKVVIASRNGRVQQSHEFDDITKSLIVNVVNKKWKTVANVLYKHPCLKRELLEPLRKRVANEFKEYCGNSSESMMKQNSPEELEAFSNKFLVNEVRQSCPLWMACVSGACNASSDMKVKEINAIALASAVAARCRNQKMSAVAYRISAILFHSGTKYNDIQRLNKLSVCMSPEMIVEMERKMGQSCERKLLVWKKEIEKSRKAMLLLEEVKEKQVGVPNEDDMEVDSKVCFSEETLSKYTTFATDTYNHCKEVLNTVANSGCTINDDHLVKAINFLSCEKLPLYK